MVPISWIVDSTKTTRPRLQQCQAPRMDKEKERTSNKIGFKLFYSWIITFELYKTMNQVYCLIVDLQYRLFCVHYDKHLTLLDMGGVPHNV